MRDFFNEQLPQHRTPRTYNAIHKPGDGTTHEVSMWVCSKDNTMNTEQWFFAVQTKYSGGGEHDGKTETHFFIDERDAWNYRAKQLGCTRPQMIVPGDQYMTQMGQVRTENHIVEPDFRSNTLWEGYLLQEALNSLD